MTNQATAQGSNLRPDEYEDEEGRIWTKPKRLSRYDKAFTKLRKLQAERDALTAQPELIGKDKRHLLILENNIERAQASFDREKKRAKDDVARRYESIDEWRSGEGREKYNASRRERIQPNTKLSDMTPEQIKRHKNDQAADRVWRSGRRKAGWTEEQIQAGLIVRLRNREAKRTAESQEDEDIAAMKASPTFGMF